MNKNVRRSCIFVAIILFSFAFGFLFDKACAAVEMKKHPTDPAYTQYVMKYAEEYGTDPALILAVIKTASSFQNGLISDEGKIGYMQLNEQQFSFVRDSILKRSQEDVGLIYHPEKNIEYGVAYYSYLSAEYSNTEMTLAAYFAGPDTVARWAAESGLDKSGYVLERIPDAKINRMVKKTMKSCKIYEKILNKESLGHGKE